MVKLALTAAVVDTLISIAIMFYNRDQILIDWHTYIAQGEGVLDGIYDYSKIIGPSGYVAYPAGHCYLYGLLSLLQINTKWLYSQLLMVFIHTLSTYVLVAIIEKAVTQRHLQIMAALLYLLQCRERDQCILMLQNDSFMILFMEIGILAVLNNQIILSMLFFNLGLSIKGGLVLWLPGYLLVLAKKRSILCPIFFLGFTYAFQYAIAYPFLKVNTKAYMNASFPTVRRHEKMYTNLYFEIPEDTFLSPVFKNGVIATMLGVNVLFLFFVWTDWRKFFADIRLYPLSLRIGNISATETVQIIYTSVLIQATFSHVGHPHFMLWYAPIYPFLIAICKLPIELQFILTILNDQCNNKQRIEMHFLKYGVAFTHLLILYKLWRKQTTESNNERTAEKIKKLN